MLACSGPCPGFVCVCVCVCIWMGFGSLLFFTCVFLVSGWLLVRDYTPDHSLLSFCCEFWFTGGTWIHLGLFFCFFLLLQLFPFPFAVLLPILKRDHILWSWADFRQAALTGPPRLCVWLPSEWDLGLCSYLHVCVWLNISKAFSYISAPIYMKLHFTRSWPIWPSILKFDIPYFVSTLPFTHASLYSLIVAPSSIEI